MRVDYILKLDISHSCFVFYYYRNNVPNVFVNMIRGQMMRLDNAFLPLISNICWTSLTIPQVLNDVESVLDRIEMFCKEVTLFIKVIQEKY